jgi:hypothetical protein
MKELLAALADAKIGRNTKILTERVTANVTPGLRFTQELTTITNLYGKFYTPFKPFTPLYLPLQTILCTTTTQISDHIVLVCDDVTLKKGL